MPLPLVPGLDTVQLEREGWAVLRGVVHPAVCARATACIDGILGPPVAEVQIQGRGQLDADLEATGSRWPDPDGLPLISLGGPYRAKVMHPIRDEVTAELVSPLAPIFAQLYQSRRPQDLKLLQHMFTRTDALPLGHAAGAHSAADGAVGAQPNANGTVHDRDGSSGISWHMDDAFLEEHRTAVPMQSYFHCMLALSPVRRDGSPYLVCPGSMTRAREVVRNLSPAERDLFDPGERRTVLPGLILPQIPKDHQPPVEVYLEPGDLLVHDPMLTHSASDNHGAVPSRHVLFSTFFDVNAIGTTLVGLRNRMAAAPTTKFPRELREGLPPEWRGLLDWELPLQDAGRSQTMEEQNRTLGAGSVSMEEKGNRVVKL